MEEKEERIIKSKLRVQKHGEVFTPAWMVQKMLDTPGIKEACEEIDSTFLEPAAGDGNFIVAILQRKLAMVSEDYSQTLSQYEHFSLFALSTLYAIELLDDNAQMCAMNMLQAYLTAYQEKAARFGRKTKDKVIESAKVIIKSNVQQGDFLKRTDKGGDPIVFSEWKPKSLTGKTIRVDRTEYSLDEIHAQVEKPPGTLYVPGKARDFSQISFFDELEEDPEIPEPMSYAQALMTQVYREELVPNER